MAGMRGAKYCAIILLWIGSASARLGICPPAKDGSSSDRTKYASTLLLLGQTQALRCHYPQLPLEKLGSKLLWFKENEQVSNTSDGRVTITEDVVNAPDNISHSCPARFFKNTSFVLSVLSIRNIEKSDYGVYDCKLVNNNNDAALKMEKEANTNIIDSFTLKGLAFLVWGTELYPKLTNKCKTTVTCHVTCFDCCTCDTGLCEMMLLKDNKMVTSTSSVTANGHIFKSSFKLSINGLEDFGDYFCVLKQHVVDCLDGSMIENFKVGESLHLGRPSVIYTKPEARKIDAVAVQIACPYMHSWSPSTVPPLPSRDVVLTKDGKEVASNTYSSVAMGELFSLTKTVQDVHGRYECLVRRKDHGCLNLSRIYERGLQSKTYLDLEPVTVIAGLKATFNYTCGFLVEHGEENSFTVAVTLDGKEVFRLDVETNSTAVENIDKVLATFEIKTKDPTSYGVYNCFLEKNGLPYPNAEHMKCHSEEDGLQQICNTFQIIYPWSVIPQNETIYASLGSTIYLPCHGAKGIRLADLETQASQLSIHHNNEQITDGDSHTALIRQRFRDSENIVSFLWAIVEIDNLEAFGAYECRYKDNTEANESLVTRHYFFIEARDWAEQALNIYNSIKNIHHNTMSFLKKFDADVEEFHQTLLTALNTIRNLKSVAILGWLLLVAVLLVAITWCSIRVYFFASWKLEERDIHNALDKIHQMNALGGPIEGGHPYDVFISYSSEQADWVRNDLLHDLESNDYRVYLDVRDFIPGKPVITNIANGVYQSRKVIVVMSKTFINKGWCMYELVLTFKRKLDQKENCVIVIKYDDCKIPRGLALRTYLDWTELMARETFWAKLHDWLGPVDSCIEEEDKEEVDEWFECQDSGSPPTQQDGVDPADPQERDDVVIRQRQNIPSIGCD